MVSGFCKGPNALSRICAKDTMFQNNWSLVSNRCLLVSTFTRQQTKNPLIEGGRLPYLLSNQTRRRFNRATSPTRIEGSCRHGRRLNRSICFRHVTFSMSVYDGDDRVLSDSRVWQGSSSIPELAKDALRRDAGLHDLDHCMLSLLRARIVSHAPFR